jgi:predicted SAM-dependent methyltransferase
MDDRDFEPAMKLNIGCGKQTWGGYYCVDAVRHPKARREPDLLHAFEFAKDGALLNPLPLADGCADELHSYHFVEHVYRWEATNLLAEFHRLLKPAGALVLELPNIAAAARNLIAGMDDQMAMWPLYGDWSHRDPYMMHKHGYTPGTIATLLKESGFNDIRVLPPVTHGAKANRDMRVEAVKA